MRKENTIYIYKKARKVNKKQKSQKKISNF